METQTQEDYPPVTKDTLIAGILKMYATGALDEKLSISQIRKFAEDTRLNWNTL